MGALEWVLGEVQHKVCLQGPQPYLSGHGALLALLLVLLRLGFSLDLWGALGPSFAPVLA